MRLRHYWNGEFRDGTGAFDIVNPYTELKIADQPIATKEDVDSAAHSAREGFTRWNKKSRSERSSILRKCGDLIRSHAEELARLESQANGKTYQEAFIDDIPESADVFDYYAEWINKSYSDVCPVEGGYLNYTTHEPYGVVGLIVPWNFPLLMACWKIAPALATGNTVVLKPSEFTPTTVARFFELIHAAHLFPPGVVNLVLGDGTTGAAVAHCEHIDKLAFTGSTGTGKKLVQASGASNLKALTLELGGKSPNIIFADAPDLKFAINRTFTAMFSHKGEKCSEPTRLYVERPIYEAVVGEIARQCEASILGDPFSSSTTQGPQAHKAHYEKINDYLKIGREENLRCLAGGGPTKDMKGFFVRPTLYGNVPASSRLMKEEIFGPVLVAAPFDTEEEVVSLANDSGFGLAAGAWTANVDRCLRLTKSLQAGMIFMNRYGCYDFASPFGGIKQSGWGREMAKHSLSSYTRVKSVWLRYSV